MASNILSLPTPTPSNNSNFGVNFDGWSNATLTELQRIYNYGFRHIRVTIIWASHEFAGRGIYSFTASQYNLDNFVSLCEQAGLKVMLLVLGSNSLYASSNQRSGGQDLNGYTNYLSGTDTAAMWTGYANFFRTLVGRYAGRGHMFEVWNEPNLDTYWQPQANLSEFMALIDRVGPMVKKAYPNEIIGVGGLSPDASTYDWLFQDSWLDGYFRKGVLHHYDFIGLHPYRYYDDPETLTADLVKFKARLDKGVTKGRTVRLSINEIGQHNFAVCGQFAPSSYSATNSASGGVNLLRWSSNITNGVWQGVWVKPAITAGQADPFSGTGAFKLASADRNAGPNGRYWSGIFQEADLTLPNYYTYSVWLKADAPMVVEVGPYESDRTGFRRFNVTTSWARYSFTFNLASQQFSPKRAICIRETGKNNPAWYIYGPQVELVNATTQQKSDAFEALAADYLARFYQVCMDSGICANMTWFSWKDDSNTATVEASMGILKADGSMKTTLADTLDSKVPWTVTKTLVNGTTI